MAEILFMLKDNLNPDPKLRYCKGDIVEVQNDGFQWGTEMSYFGVLKISGLAVSKIIKYMASELELNPETSKFDQIKKRRVWRFLINNIPPSIKREFIQNHEYTATVEQVRNFIQNKITLEADQGL